MDVSIMALIVLIGSQAVGKMTVGKELEKQIDGKLLFNHQTLDLFADFLGYSKDAFLLSDRTRKELFKAFVNNPETNTTKTIIFTVVIDFDSAYDIEFLQDIASIFLEANQEVYFVELVAALRERLKRNVHEERLKAKPSKRDTNFSRKELLTSKFLLHYGYIVMSVVVQIVKYPPSIFHFNLILKRGNFLNQYYSLLYLLRNLD